MKRNKGFTLVELLGVIVILAILVLVATPAVTNIITKSSKNSYKSEILNMAKDMDRAFTEKMGKKIKSISSASELALDTSIYNVSTGGKSYKYLCMTLKDLVDGQYTKKDLGTEYGGYIQMWVPDNAGETITFVNTTNTSFYLQGLLSVITDSEFMPTQTAATGITTPTSSTTCPSNYTIPASTVINVQDK